MGEVLVALIALEWSLAGVNPKVIFELVGLCKALVTLITGVWPLSGVSPNMNSEMT